MRHMNSSVRNFLRAKAHDLSPVVMVGKNGLDDAVVKALDEALTHHELVKVKFQSNRDGMKQITSDLTEATKAELVGTVGFISIFFRPSEKKLIEIPKSLTR